MFIPLFHKTKVKSQRHWFANEARQMTKDGIKIKFGETLNNVYAIIENQSKKYGANSYTFSGTSYEPYFSSSIKKLLIEDLKIRGYVVEEFKEEKTYTNQQYIPTKYTVDSLKVSW